MTNETTELHMNAEELFWLYTNLAGYWTVGAWWDTGRNDPTDEDFLQMSLALIWIQSARKAYDEIHHPGAAQARYEELQESYRAISRAREIALNEKGNK